MATEILLPQKIEVVKLEVVEDDVVEIGDAQEVVLVGGIDSVEEEEVAVVTDQQSSSVPKKLGVQSVVLKKNAKTAPRNGGVEKVMRSSLRDQKSNLSQSLSFSSKGIPGNVLRRSVDVISQSPPNGSQDMLDLDANVSRSATRASHKSARSASSVVSSSDAKKDGVSSRRSTLISGPGFRHSMSGRIGLLKTANGSSSDKTLPSDQDIRTATQVVTVEDGEPLLTALDTTTRSLRSISSSGFSFRSNERAEKRKEFFMKLEEKVQAKEAEKTNMQAKSKEKQDAEIKQLRKSLMFKAAPMPSFYQEPAPPKVELKKTPTTHPKSPKLGRNKPSAAAVDEKIENNGGCVSTTTKPLKTEKDQPSGDSLILAKPEIRKSLTKLPSKKRSSSKQEPKVMPMVPDVENVLTGKGETLNNGSKTAEESFILVGESATIEEEEILNLSEPVAFNEDAVIISEYLDTV